jgi:sn-glycerol 3-phosphate transport system substrate-binding protein
MAKQIDRRRFLRGTALGAGALALTACGANQAAAPAAPVATTAPAAVSSTGSTTEVVYWGSFSGNLGKAEQAIVDSFNSSQKDVKVNYQFQGNYEETAQKLTAALQAKTTPDISLLSDVWWFKFYTAGALAPLNDLLAAEKIDTSDFQEVLLKEGTRRDQVMWVPFARSTPLFYYNKDMWAAAGLPDRGPENWTELGTWAEQLVKRDGDQLKVSAFAHPNAGSYIAWLFQGVVWQFGGRYSDPDFNIRITEPNAIKAAQFYADTTQKMKWASAVKSVDQDFVNGLTASSMMSTGALSGVMANAKFNVGTAFLPQQDGFGCPTGGAGLAVLASSPKEKQQAAMKFINFVTSTEGTTNWSQATGYMPVRKSAAASPQMQEFFTKNPNFKTAVDQLPKTQPQDVARVYIPGGDQIIGKGLERIVISGEQPDVVFADVARTLADTAKPVIEAVKRVEA